MGDGMLGAVLQEPRADLRPFVPRGSIDWLSERPDARHHQLTATLVFVDISGFTAMSERLARLGRVGAEEVTDLLNETFSRLLAAAYADAGSLLKFGGDALLLQFEGDDHAARAVQAAWTMRAELRQLQPLQSSAGRVRLRMSIGVHTGTMDQFLVGTNHRELILAGPGATTTVQMEAAAGPGQIMVSDAVVEALGSRISVARMDPGNLLRGAPPRPTAPAVVDLRDQARDLPGILLSDPVRRRLDGGIPEAEHRPCAIGFIKFLGVDEHLEAHGADRTASALEELVDATVDAAGPDEVCLLSSDVDAGGGKLILTAGVPTSREFDGERMLRALRRLMDSHPPFPLKVGVHDGPVFAGVVGPWFRLSYTIIGDAVNLAARVMGHAEPGVILATPEVLNRSQALFAITEIPPFSVKGKAEPVTAYQVGALTAERARRPRARFRLAGRAAELAEVLEQIDAAATSTGRLIQLTGPAGIGKSRLIDEIHERRPHIELVMATCSQYESATPYYAAGALLRSLLELSTPVTGESLAKAVTRVAPALADAIPLIGDVIGVDVPDNDATADLTPGFRAERAVQSATALIEATIPEPATIVVEDTHWIDPESRVLLLAIARTALPRRRWTLLLTSRHQVVLDAKVELDEAVVALEPLSPGEARELVYAAVEDGVVTLDRAQAILAKAAGNPLFLQELLEVNGEDELPESIDALIQTQLDQLTERDRELLGHAAVLGAEIEVGILEATSGIDRDGQQAAFSRLGGFVEPAGPGVFRFRHALVRDGAYGRLPFRRRRELHRRAAEVLAERRGHGYRPDLLALHTYHARDWEAAREYALEAAQIASSRFANLTAAQQYRHAIQSARYVRDLPDAELADTWEHLGDALMRASSYDEAVLAYQRAKALAGPEQQVRLCGQLGQLRERQGRYRDALRWFSRATKLDASLRTGAMGRMLVETAIVRIRQGKPHAAIALAEQAEQLDADVQTMARTSYVKAWAAMLLGEDADEERRRTLRLFEEADDLIGQGLAYNIISMAAYYQGDWDVATEAYERAGVLRRRVGDEVAAAAAAGNLGELLADQGHFDRARGLLEECRSVCAAAGFRSSAYFAAMTLGRLDARVGRYEEAEAQIKEAMGGLEAIEMPWLVFDARRYLAELALFRGDHQLAVAEADVLDSSANLGTAGFRAVGDRLRTCVLLEQADVSSAQVLAERLLARLEPGARDYDTALSLVAVAAAFEAAGDERGDAIRATASSSLDRLGVVVPGELLVFGPTSARSDRSSRLATS